MNRTPYHLLKPSPWPLTFSLSAFVGAIGFVALNHQYQFGKSTLLVGSLSLVAVFSLWCRDTFRESLNLGMHTVLTKTGASSGFVTFMISETFFFAAFIWSFFYTALSPTVHIGALWPPLSISPVFPWTIPFLNTIILLSSGATITWAHNSILANNRQQAIWGLFWTILLGSLFSLLQALEYHFSPFTLSDSSFGTVMYTTLTLHAFHIWIGVIWLTICFTRLVHYKLNSLFHQIVEGALLFWHIIDAIWIILFLFFYVWVSPN